MIITSCNGPTRTKAKNRSTYDSTYQYDNEYNTPTYNNDQEDGNSAYSEDAPVDDGYESCDFNYGTNIEAAFCPNTNPNMRGQFQAKFKYAASSLNRTCIIPINKNSSGSVYVGDFYCRSHVPGEKIEDKFTNTNLEFVNGVMIIREEALPYYEACIHAGAQPQQQSCPGWQPQISSQYINQYELAKSRGISVAPNVTIDFIQTWEPYYLCCYFTDKYQFEEILF